MDFNYLSPYIRVATDSTIQAPWKLNQRVIFDYELLYIKEGQVKITIEDEVYMGVPGDVFLFKPKQTHSMEIMGNNNLRQPHIHFDLFYEESSSEVKVCFRPLEKINTEEMNFFRKDITSNSQMHLPSKIKIKNIEFFENLLFEIIHEYSEKELFYNISAKGHFINLWIYIIKECEENENISYKAKMKELNKIKEFLHSNLDKEVTLDRLSALFNISKFHLIRLFKSAYGMTPIHYHTILRIEKAKEIVQYSDFSLTEISERFGFHSINAFSRAFRKVEGVAPSFYRNKIYGN
ncbi:MAG TPA: AraC family transcriptional regulator [Clostridiaceae bacterium]